VVIDRRLIRRTSGRSSRLVPTTKAAASRLAAKWPAPAIVPTIAEHHSVARC
jgi:hypothetical protein